MSILKVIHLLPFFQISYLLVPKIESYFKYFLTRVPKNNYCDGGGSSPAPKHWPLNTVVWQKDFVWYHYNVNFMSIKVVNLENYTFSNLIFQKVLQN